MISVLDHNTVLIPVEVTAQIFEYLPTVSLLCCEGVCKEWYRILNSDEVIASETVEQEQNGHSLMVSSFWNNVLRREFAFDAPLMTPPVLPTPNRDYYKDEFGEYIDYDEVGTSYPDERTKEDMIRRCVVTTIRHPLVVPTKHKPVPNLPPRLSHKEACVHCAKLLVQFMPSIDRCSSMDVDRSKTIHIQGAQQVGKTMLSQTITGRKSMYDEATTLGVRVRFLYVLVGDFVYKVGVVDHGGNEGVRPLASFPLLHRKLNCTVCVFAADDEDSVNQIETLYKQYQIKERPGPDENTFVVFGNKMDLLTTTKDNQRTSYEQTLQNARDICQRLNLPLILGSKNDNRAVHMLLAHLFCESN